LQQYQSFRRVPVQREKANDMTARSVTTAMQLFRILLAWLGAVVVTGATGSILQTQFNLAALAAIGATVPIGLRLQTTLQDIAGFGPLMALIAAGGFALALPVAAWLARRRPSWRITAYTAAGGAALAAALLLMNTLVPITLIGATRGPGGFLALVAAGALGGRVFALLLTRRDGRGVA
jgi:hypothetical protein